MGAEMYVHELCLQWCNRQLQRLLLLLQFVHVELGVQEMHAQLRLF